MPTKKRKQKKTHAVPPASDSLNILHTTLLGTLKAAPEAFCLRHPPRDVRMVDFPDNLPNLYVPVLDAEILRLAAHLREVQKVFLKTHNGIYLLSAFLLAHESNLYPPLWVLDALALSFKNYHSNPEASPLDKWLGLQRGRGQKTASGEAAQQARDRDLAVDIWLLQCKFGLTVSEAVEVVQETLNDPSLLPRIRWEKRLKRTLTFDSLAKLYSCKWKPKFGLTKEYYDLIIAPHCPKSFWPSFLKGFSTRDLSEKLKIKLRLD